MVRFEDAPDKWQCRGAIHAYYSTLLISAMYLTYIA